jgi:hypothetical protein
MTNLDGNKEGGEPEKIVITAMKSDQTKIKIKKDKAQHELEQVIGEKKKAEFTEDFISLAVLCFTQSNVDEMMIVPAKRA